MINVLLKWGTLLAIWKKYGSAIKALPILLLMILIVYAMHGDYIEYAQVSENKDYIAWSFLIKWLAILSVLAIYWYYVKAVLRPSSARASAKNSVRARLSEAESRSGAKSVHAATDYEASNYAGRDKNSRDLNNGDHEKGREDSEQGETKATPRSAFDAIRKKKHLRSRAELIIERAKNQSQ